MSLAGRLRGSKKRKSNPSHHFPIYPNQLRKRNVAAIVRSQATRSLCRVLSRISPISALRNVPIPYGISRLAAVRAQAAHDSARPAPTMDPLTPSEARTALGPGGIRERFQEESRNTNAKSNNHEERTRRGEHTKNSQIVHSMHSPLPH